MTTWDNKENDVWQMGNFKINVKTETPVRCESTGAMLTGSQVAKAKMVELSRFHRLGVYRYEKRDVAEDTKGGTFFKSALGHFKQRDADQCDPKSEIGCKSTGIWKKRRSIFFWDAAPGRCKNTDKHIRQQREKRRQCDDSGRCEHGISVWVYN